MVRRGVLPPDLSSLDRNRKSWWEAKMLAKNLHDHVRSLVDDHNRGHMNRDILCFLTGVAIAHASGTVPTPDEVAAYLSIFGV
jgi:hypothetical protein